jgi:hypothetical protein
MQDLCAKITHNVLKTLIPSSDVNSPEDFVFMSLFQLSGIENDLKIWILVSETHMENNNLHIKKK